MGESRAGAAKELTCSPFDIVSPVCVLHVLGSWDKIKPLRFLVRKVLELLVVSSITN